MTNQSDQSSSLKERGRHFQVSLRFIILFIFITLYLITSFLIVAIRSIAYEKELNYTSQTLMHHASDAVYRELNNGIKPIQVEGEFTAKLIQAGVVSQNNKELKPYLYYLVKTMPLVISAYYGDEHGNFMVARKEKNGTVTTEVVRDEGKLISQVEYHDAQGRMIKEEPSPSPDMDPRIKPWYQSISSTGKLAWLDINTYPHATGITLGIPVFDDKQQIKGVLGLIVSLNYLNDFVSRQQISTGGYSFIVSRNNDLIAYPQREPFNQVELHRAGISNIHQSGLSLIDKSFDHFKQTGINPIVMVYEGQTYLVSYRPVLDIGTKQWLIGVVVPKNDFTGFLQQLNSISFLVASVVLILGVIFYSILVSRIVKPLNLLVKETRKIKSFDLEDDITIQSRIKEVNQLKNALLSMKRGLRHFQKYVPKTLVQQLIESGQDIGVGGIKTNLVVLFSDIENFTSITRTVDPQQLMVQICEYFECITTIILKENGTIDKFIGDSVMAFWGAPLIEVQPCEHAARAALMCQTRLKALNQAWELRGWPPFITRIGIHKGDAIVGNVGSSERLNYTALGDTINITNRLEGINKNYNTKIIVSETVYQDIKDKFVLREVDSVMLKGITQPMRVYELLSETMQDIKFDIESYRHEFEQGLQTLHQDKFDIALHHFKRCLEIYPDDYLVPKFIRQCEEKRTGW